MRKLNFLKTMLLLCALIVGNASAWAESVVWTFTEVASGTLGTEGNIVTFTSTDGSASTLTYVSGKKDALINESATINEVSYTYYLKENGTDKSTSRVKKFSAPYAKFKITVVYAGTASGTTTIHNNTTDADLGTITAATSSAVTSSTFTATVGDEIAIWCGGKSYLYSIICEKVSSDKTASTFALTSEDEVELSVDGTSDITYSNNAGTVTFTSANTDIAEVSSTGVITAKAPGKTTITVSDPGSASVDEGSATVTVLVPYVAAAADSYVFTIDQYAFNNKANTKHYFKNGFTMTLNSAADCQYAAIDENTGIKYSHARLYTINVPDGVTVKYAEIRARSNYDDTSDAAKWGNVFGTNYDENLPYKNQDPAEKDFVIASPVAGGTLVFQPSGNQIQAIITLSTKEYHEKYAVSYAAGEGSGTMEGTTVRGGETLTLPASTFTAPIEKGFDGWLCSIDGVVYAAGAEYTMTDAATTFTAQYESPNGKLIVKAIVTATNKATVNGAIGGTGDVNLQDGGSDGWKFGGDTHHIGVTLADGWNFKTGDIFNVHITKVADMANTTIILYNKDRSISYDTEIQGVLGDNMIAIPAALNGQNELYIYRIHEPANKWNAYIDYIEVYRPDVITLNAKGFTTYSRKNNFTIFDGADAYKMALNTAEKEIAGTKITGNIPAGEGVLLKGEAGASVKIIETSDADPIAGNDLKGTTQADGSLVAMGTANYYVLSGDTFVTFTGTEFTANKAYFESATPLAHALNIVFEDGETTGINAVETQKMENNEFYNLAGQRVAQPSKGLYIVNGKKVIIK